MTFFSREQSPDDRQQEDERLRTYNPQITGFCRDMRKLEVDFSSEH